MTQSVSARTASENFSIADITSSGDCTLFNGTTTGTVDIASNAGRSGMISIGNAASSGIINIDAGSSALHVVGAKTIVSNTLDSETPASPAFLFNNATGSVTLCRNMEGGIFSIGESLTRTGPIYLGHVSGTGKIVVADGTGIDLNSPVLKVPVEIKSYSGAFDQSLFDEKTSGGVTFCNNASRSGSLTIGNSLSSGPITVDAGSGVLTMRGTNYKDSNFTPSISDSSGNSGTVTIQRAIYSRVGSVIHCSVHVTLTSKGSMVAGDAVRIGGFPSTSSYIQTVSSVMGGTIFNGGPDGIYRLQFYQGNTYGVIRINHPPTSNNALMSVSQLGATGALEYNFSYHV